MTNIISSEQSTTLPFVVTFITLGIAWTVLHILDCCLQLCLDGSQEDEIQEHEMQEHEIQEDEIQEDADVLQVANHRKWLNRIIVSPRRMRGRSRALEFDMSSSDDEASIMPKMRTRSSYKNYNSD